MLPEMDLSYRKQLDIMCHRINANKHLQQLFMYKTYVAWIFSCAFPLNYYPGCPPRLCSWALCRRPCDDA